MNNSDHNFIEITQQTKLRVAPVALVVSSDSSRAVRQARHGQNAWAPHVDRVESCRVETWRAKWNLGYSSAVGYICSLFSAHTEKYRWFCSQSINCHNVTRDRDFLQRNNILAISQCVIFTAHAGKRLFACFVQNLTSPFYKKRCISPLLKQ